jgi:hypothetical protein
MYDNDHNLDSPEWRTSTERLPEEPEPRHWIRWTIVVLLVATIGGLWWYGYPSLEQLPAMLTQFPSVSRTLTATDGRLSNTETKLQGWAARQEELQQRVADLSNKVDSGFRAARKHVHDLQAEIYRRVHAEVATQTKAIDTQIVSLRATTEADQARLEKLQAELVTLRQEAVQQADQLRNVREQIEREAANRDQQLVTLNEQANRKAREVEELARKLEPVRVDFEVTRNRSRQLTEGISLGITGTDLSHRRASGWMWVMPERRTIWLRDQGAQQPVVFYGYQDGQRRELVITNVTRDSVAGYLLLPADGAPKVTASVASVEIRP